jgi:hypothetical protein
VNFKFKFFGTDKKLWVGGERGREKKKKSSGWATEKPFIDAHRSLVRERERE